MKLGVDVLQLQRLFTLFLLGIFLSGCGDAGDQDKLYRQVQELAAQNEEAGSFNVALSDLTDFEWDEAIVFKHPASGEEMEAATGIKYQGSLDLTYGIFFVKDKEIVYEELFPMDFESQSRFMIYPHSGDNIGSKPHFAIFTPASEFTCFITESNYTVKPID